MPVKQTISEEIKLLLDQKGKTCVSIIVPLYSITFDQKADKIHLEKAVNEACKELVNNYADTAEKLIEAIKNLRGKIQIDRNNEGIGLYVSENVSFYSTFPFPVNENISVDNSFRIKELLQKEQYSIPYNILYVDESEIKLFTGKLKQLQEVRNGEFPMIYEEEYEYQPPSRTTSFAGHSHVKDFEKDEASIKKIRHESFIHQADELLHKYLQHSQALVLCGVTRYTSAFLNRTIHADKVVTVLNGNYKRFDEAEFANLVWPSIEAVIYERILDEIGNYKEKLGEGLTNEGIVPVWDAVANGRGETLLVEKSLEVKAYTTNHGSWQLFLQQPTRKHTELKDAVNDLLQILLEKNGRVVFTEDGMLSEYQRIALISRYRYF